MRLLVVEDDISIQLFLKRALTEAGYQVDAASTAKAWGNYHGTIWDWATLVGTVGLFLTGILLAVRFMPVISMFEMRALIQRQRGGERA